MSIANDLGYYEITDKPGLRFENKIQALQSCNDISQIKWVFQDKQFASINWENEPKEDLYELYRQRAMSLRLKSSARRYSVQWGFYQCVFSPFFFFELGLRMHVFAHHE